MICTKLKLKKNEIQMMHKLKTGALLEAAVNMGFLGVCKKKDSDKIINFTKVISFLSCKSLINQKNSRGVICLIYDELLFEKKR